MHYGGPTETSFEPFVKTLLSVRTIGSEQGQGVITKCPIETVRSLPIMSQIARFSTSGPKASETAFEPFGVSSLNLFQPDRPTGRRSSR